MEKSLELQSGPWVLARELVLGSDGFAGSLPVVRAFCERSPSGVKITNWLEEPREWVDGRGAAHTSIPGGLVDVSVLPAWGGQMHRPAEEATHRG